VRTLATRAHVVAEGAGGASLAAALGGSRVIDASGKPAMRLDGPLVCVISGGNIDPAKLAVILDGRVP